jgi:hypothetical protein
MTDMESIRLQIVRRLPTRVRWLVHEDPLDFDFSRSSASLSPVTHADVNDITTIEPEWTLLRIFGQQDYCEGGGATPYLGVHIESGAILGLDLERQDSHIFLLNSDFDRFIRTFLVFDQVLRSGSLSPAQLARRASEIDAAAFPRSDWRLLAECVSE